MPVPDSHAYAARTVSDVPAEILDLWPSGGVVVLRGAAGSGKSSQLRDIADHVAVLGGVCLRAAGTVDSVDLFGIDALTHALRDQFEHLGDAGLAHHLAKLRRISRDGPTTYSVAVEHTVAAALKHVRGHGRILLTLDDVDLIDDPVPLAETCRGAGVVLVASCQERARHQSPLAELIAIADVVVPVYAYDEEQLAAIVGREIGSVPHPTLWVALRHALGSAASNPGVLVATIRRMTNEGSLRHVRGRLVRRPGAGPVPMLPSSRLSDRVEPLGEPDRAVLRAVRAAGAITMADLPRIANSSRVPLDQAGQAVDRLVAEERLTLAAGNRLVPCGPAPDSAASAPENVPAGPALVIVPSSRASRLSARELEVVELIAAGHRNSWIASRLGISERAVERHVTRALAKSGCRSRVELVVAHLHRAFPE
jgi:DNA-binding CsgD family transcriptional regulator